jgi:beta-mannanase
MISVRASETWRQVAGTQPGSALHNNIVRWAREIKSRGGNILVAYHHEPEAGGSTGYGTAQEFIAAYRKVVTIFRQQGVTNVQWTVQMTAWSFRAPSTDRRYAAKWYPGDAYVDNVGADAYAWGACGEGQGNWLELKAIVDPVLAFARAHGKAASLPEFGAHADSRREQWIRNAHRYFLDNQDVLAAAFYFNRLPTNLANADCRWALRTEGEYDAFGDIARDVRFTS